LRGVFAADPAVRDLIDSVADHPYSGSPRSTVAGAIAFREVVNANVPNGSQLGLWINEFGWGTQGACDWLCAGPPSSGWLDPGTEASYEATQARWLTDAINGMMVRRQSLNLRGLMMWTLADQPTDRLQTQLASNLAIAFSERHAVILATSRAPRSAPIRRCLARRNGVSEKTAAV